MQFLFFFFWLRYLGIRADFFLSGDVGGRMVIQNEGWWGSGYRRPLRCIVRLSVRRRGRQRENPPFQLNNITAVQRYLQQWQSGTLSTVLSIQAVETQYMRMLSDFYYYYYFFFLCIQFPDEIEKMQKFSLNTFSGAGKQILEIMMENISENVL